MQTFGGIVPMDSFAPLFLKGKDAQDLLHRLSTNDLRRIPEAGAIRTVLTNEKGRIIDWVELRPGKDHLLVVCHAGARETVKGWIEKYIITDDVEVLPVSLDMRLTWILLPLTDSSMIRRKIQDDVQRYTLEDLGMWWSSMGPFVGIRGVMAPDLLREFLESAGAMGLEYLTHEAYTALRVAAGVPSCPEELNHAHNPLESPVRSDVSFTKGCYVGQEVIARLDSYGKVQRKLVVLRVHGKLPAADRSAEILVDNLLAGAVTSVGACLGDGSGLVMGYVEKDVATGGKAISVRVEALQVAAEVFSPYELEGWPLERGT
jgi:tRNA-modifying protein YgfZ